MGAAHVIRRIEYAVSEEDRAQGFWLFVGTVFRFAEVELRVVVII